MTGVAMINQRSWKSVLEKNDEYSQSRRDDFYFHSRTAESLFTELTSQLYCSLFPKIIKLMSGNTLSLLCLVFFVKGVHLLYFDEAHATDVANIESSFLLKVCFITFIKLL